MNSEKIKKIKEAGWEVGDILPENYRLSFAFVFQQIRAQSYAKRIKNGN